MRFSVHFGQEKLTKANDVLSINVADKRSECLFVDIFFASITESASLFVLELARGTGKLFLFVSPLKKM